MLNIENADTKNECASTPRVAADPILDVNMPAMGGPITYAILSITSKYPLARPNCSESYDTLYGIFISHHAHYCQIAPEI